VWPQTLQEQSHQGSRQLPLLLQPTLPGPRTRRGEAGEGWGGCTAPGSVWGEQGGCWGPHRVSPPPFAGAVLMHNRRVGAVWGVSRAGGLGMNFHQPKDLVSSVIPHHGSDAPDLDCSRLGYRPSPYRQELKDLSTCTPRMGSFFFRACCAQRWMLLLPNRRG